MDTAYFYLTPEGKELAERLAKECPGDVYGKENFKENLREAFHKYDYLVCIMATGIVVRILAPLIEKKTSDPGVVVLDQKGQFAISLLSGHLGGANDLARKMASISGGTPVITTATDVAGELSFDTFAKKYDMAIENIGKLKHVSGTLLEGKPVRVVCEEKWIEKCPELKENVDNKKLQWIPYEKKSELSTILDEFGDSEKKKSYPPMVVIHEGMKLSTDSYPAPILYLRPRTVHAGIGCKRNMDGEAILESLLQVLKEERLSPLSLKSIATIPLKADEAGIAYTCEQLKTPLSVISTEEIEKINLDALGIAQSDFVGKQTGVLSVSTASAYLSSGKGKILRDKAKFKGITVALAMSRDC